jgi:hypothetical protein
MIYYNFTTLVIRLYIFEIFDTALIPLPPYCEDRVANIKNFKKSEQGTIDSKCNKYENNWNGIPIPAVSSV